MRMMKHAMLILSPTCGFCHPASRSERRCQEVNIARSAFSLRRPHETSFPNMPSGHTMKTGHIYIVFYFHMQCIFMCIRYMNMRFSLDL